MNEPTQNVELSEQWGQFTRLLANRLWTILTFLTVTLLIVVVGTSIQTPVYRSAATVLIDMETPSILTVSTSRDDSTVGQSNYLTYADYYRTQLEIMKSRAIAERVFANLKLGELKQYAGEKDPIGTLLSQVKVEPIKQTRLARIFADDGDGEQAAKIANEFAIVFVEENLAKAAITEAMTLMKNEYIKLQSKEAELTKRYKGKFPTVVRTRQRMEQLEKSIEQEMENQLQYDRRRSVVKSPVTEEPSKPLLERLRESSMEGGLRPNNIRVQDLAQVSPKPAKPNVRLNLVLALIFGLLGGLGAAGIEELLDNSLKAPEDVEQGGRFVLLGHVPIIDGPYITSKTPTTDLEKRARYVQLGPNTQAAEAYRALRTKLLYTAAHGNARTLVVTSPASGEGKTTTVTNLGIALAQIGLRILIVDADMRKPRVHEVFHMKQKPGLSEFLNGETAFESVIQAAEIPGVWVITSGAPPSNPAELLASPQMQEFLRKASAKFDRVFLDTPPVIPVTDAVILAAMAGNVIAVTQSGKTPRQALNRMSALCSSVQAKIVGVVLNCVPTYNTPLYGYGYSSYHYGEQAKEENSKYGSKALGRLADLLKIFKIAPRPPAEGEKGKSPKRPMGRDAKSR